MRTSRSSGRSSSSSSDGSSKRRSVRRASCHRREFNRSRSRTPLRHLTCKERLDYGKSSHRQVHRSRSRRGRCSYSSCEVSYCSSRERKHRSRRRRFRHSHRHDSLRPKRVRSREVSSSSWEEAHRNRRHRLDYMPCARFGCESICHHCSIKRHHSLMKVPPDGKESEPDYSYSPRRNHKRRRKQNVSLCERLHHRSYKSRHFSPTSSEFESILKRQEGRHKFKKGNSSLVIAIQSKDEAPVLPMMQATPGNSAGKERIENSIDQDLIEDTWGTPKVSQEEIWWRTTQADRVQSNFSPKNVKLVQDMDWLSLSLNTSMSFKPKVEGIKGEDFKLCLPDNSLFKDSMGTNNFDLNIAAAGEEEKPMQSLTSKSETAQVTHRDHEKRLSNEARNHEVSLAQHSKNHMYDPIDRTSWEKGAAKNILLQTSYNEKGRFSDEEITAFPPRESSRTSPNTLHSSPTVSVGQSRPASDSPREIEERQQPNHLIFVRDSLSGTRLEDHTVYSPLRLPMPQDNHSDSTQVFDITTKFAEFSKGAGFTRICKEQANLGLLCPNETEVIVLDSEDEYFQNEMSTDMTVFLRSPENEREGSRHTKDIGEEKQFAASCKRNIMAEQNMTIVGGEKPDYVDKGGLVREIITTQTGKICSILPTGKAFTGQENEQGASQDDIYTPRLIDKPTSSVQGAENMMNNVDKVQMRESNEKEPGFCEDELNVHNYEAECGATSVDFCEQPFKHPSEDNPTSMLISPRPKPSTTRQITHSFKAKKKGTAHKIPFFVASCAEKMNACGVDDFATIPKPYFKRIVIAKARLWDAGICDLCHQGPSLSLGEWYAWCCGARLSYCHCSDETKLKLKSVMKTRKSKSKKNDNFSWSGKVHRMCAMWSSEVFEKDDEGDELHGLLNAIRRGRSLICSACREVGATLGCRVKSCRRSFHYPCADKLASQLRCRMWDGVQIPIACQGHRHVDGSCQHAKEKPSSYGKWRSKGSLLMKNLKQKQRMLAGNLFDTQQYMLNQQDSFAEEGVATQKLSIHKQRIEGIPMFHMPNGAVSEVLASSLFPGKCIDDDISEKRLTTIVIDLCSDNEDINKEIQCTESPKVIQSINTANTLQKETWCDKRTEGSVSEPHYMGDNLICEDISGGREAVMIPCTNDVDDDPHPAIEYITTSRYLGKAKGILDCLLLNKEKVAKSCDGCHHVDMDDPDAEISAHVSVKDGRRDSDCRFDWQGQPMLGRLPYDRFGRLQLGPVINDVIECNSRCPCGSRCLNKELQKGLQIALEVFKTKDRGWGVRTMNEIPRGKFVVEYVGEILTPAEADERAVKYDMLNFSCLFSVDHPEVPLHDLLVVDGFKMSNVARFINHSCEGNLRTYRVYTETTDLRFCRIGVYAARDIKIGEELSYDYNYANSRDKTDISGDPTAIKCCCGARTCRQWLWTGGGC